MIVVTGGTGRARASGGGPPLADGRDVRVLTRSAANMAPRWTTVECAIGDLHDRTSLDAALQGADGLFLLSPMDPELDVSERQAYAAAEQAGVGFVVKMSTTKPD